MVILSDTTSCSSSYNFNEPETGGPTALSGFVPQVLLYKASGLTKTGVVLFR